MKRYIDNQQLSNKRQQKGKTNWLLVGMLLIAVINFSLALSVKYWQDERASSEPVNLVRRFALPIIDTQQVDTVDKSERENVKSAISAISSIKSAATTIDLKHDQAISEGKAVEDDQLPIQLTHYNNFPTYTNSPEAVRSRQIYEEILIKGNYSRLLKDEYRTFRHRSYWHQPNVKRKDYRVQFDLSKIKHLTDPVLLEYWTVDYVGRPVELGESKGFERAIKGIEGSNRIYDFLYEQLADPSIDLRVSDMGYSQGKLTATVFSNTPGIMGKLKRIYGVKSIERRKYSGELIM